MNNSDVHLQFHLETNEIHAFAQIILNSNLSISEKNILFSKLSRGLKDINIRKKHFEATSELIPKQFSVEEVRERLVQ